MVYDCQRRRPRLAQRLQHRREGLRVAEVREDPFIAASWPRRFFAATIEAQTGSDIAGTDAARVVIHLRKRHKKRCIHFRVELAKADERNPEQTVRSVKN